MTDFSPHVWLVILVTNIRYARAVSHSCDVFNIADKICSEADGVDDLTLSFLSLSSLEIQFRKFGGVCKALKAELVRRSSTDLLSFYKYYW